MSRRKFLLHYFGEEFDNDTGDGGDMDDNMRNPKVQVEAKDQVIKLETNDNILLSIVDIIILSNKNSITINILNKKLNSIGDSVKLLINKNKIVTFCVPS